MYVHVFDIILFTHTHITEKIPATEPQAMDLQERNRLARDLQRTQRLTM